MDITVNQITPRRENGQVASVQVHFTAKTEDGSINLNGAIPLESFTEYLNFEQMNGVVKQKLVEKIMNGDLESVE